MDEKELYRVFERQRRNLILMSVLLFGLIVTGIKIKEINFVFARLENPSHDYLFLFLWGIFCYFILRYNHYLKAVGIAEFKKEVERVFYNKIAKYMVEKSDVLLLKDFDKTGSKNKYDSFERVHGFQRTDIVNKHIKTFRVAIMIIGHSNYGGTMTLSEKIIQENMDLRKFKGLKLLSWLQVSLNNFHFLEFFLPNAIAMIVYISAIPTFLRMLP